MTQTREEFLASLPEPFRPVVEEALLPAQALLEGLRTEDSLTQAAVLYRMLTESFAGIEEGPKRRTCQLLVLKILAHLGLDPRTTILVLEALQ